MRLTLHRPKQKGGYDIMGDSLRGYALSGVPEVTTLVLKTVHPKIKRALYCLYCGGYLQTVYKKIILIIQGAAVESEITSEILCRRCKAVYEIC